MQDPNTHDWTDPLAWWRSNKNFYPRIWRIAEEVLACPATSSPAERSFSVAGLTITKKRNALAPSTAKDLIFLKQAWKLGTEYEKKGFGAKNKTEAIVVV